MPERTPEWDRRRFMGAAAGLASSLGAGAFAKPARVSEVRVPKGFLWGAATAGHQVEGNNINSDSWVMENVTPTLFAEKSGDACDHYHRYEQDIALLAGLGLNTYRFSLEWSRIEPEPGAYSLAELGHYRRVLAACHERGVTPFLTLNHLTYPRWFAARGGWENPASPEQFIRFAERAARHLGDLVGVAATLNEPNLGRLLSWVPGIPVRGPVAQQMLAAAARAVGSDRFSAPIFGDLARAERGMLAAHAGAYAALKAGPGRYPVGVTLAMQDEQAVGAHSARDRKRKDVYEAWLAAAAAASDFVGVQTYTRGRVGEQGDLGPEKGVELTSFGSEFWPEALEQTIRYAAAATGKPVYVSENGVATDDDARRIVYIRRALAGMARAMADGVDVRGYIHWSLLDNFEWSSGYKPRFGLVSVDRQTFERTPKPSAAYLGQFARSGILPTVT